jgi:hypothetical protein
LSICEVSVPSSNTTVQLSVPTIQPTYAQVVTSHPPLSTLGTIETAAAIKIARLKAENQRLQSIISANNTAINDKQPAPVSNPSLPSESTAVSTMTTTVTIDQFNDLASKYDLLLSILQSIQSNQQQGIPVSSNTNMITTSDTLLMDITTTENHGQQDASGLAEQPGSKRLDSRATPNKSLLFAGADMDQSP